MTIEIRELVIEARVTDAERGQQSSLAYSVAQKKEEEARWVTLICQRVLELLREDRGRSI